MNDEEAERNHASKGRTVNTAGLGNTGSRLMSEGSVPQAGRFAPAHALAGSTQALALHKGHFLLQYAVQRSLQSGATTQVYLATDTQQHRTVVLTEYLPQELALRDAKQQVRVRQDRLAPAFERGKQAFLNDADLLAQLDHPGLVKVTHRFEHHGTAYMVTPHVEGVTLKKWLADLGTPPSEAWLQQLLPPLMQALEALHAQNRQHRDVTPENIWMRFDPQAASYLQQKPQPMLLGLDAAGRAIGAALRSPAQGLDQGFASIEQSDGDVTARQGAWTDVYGLCAVLYAAITGRAPPASLQRLAQDDMVSARKVGRGRYSPAFLSAVDAGLTVQPKERLQSIDELRQLLGAGPEAPVSTHGTTSVFGELGALRNRSGIPLWLWPALLGALLLVVAAVGALLL